MNTQELKDALGILKNALGTKGDIFVGIDNIAFQKNTISAFNSVMSVTIGMNTGIEGCVHGAELLKIVAKFPNDSETTLEHTDKGLKIVNGRSRPTMAWRDDNLTEYLAARKSDIAKAIDLPTKFLGALAAVLIKGNKSEASGVCVHGDYLFATNLNALTKADKWGGIFCDSDIIIPQGVVEFIVGSGIPFEKYYIEKRNDTPVFLHLFAPNIVMCCNLGSIELWRQRGLLISYLGGKLPSGKEIKGRLTIAEETPMSGKFGVEFSDCVDRCALLADKNNGKEFVTLNFDKDHVTVTGSNLNGTAREEIPGEWDVDETLGSCFAVEALEGLSGDVGFVKTEIADVPYVGLVVVNGDLTVCIMPMCREWRE